MPERYMTRRARELRRKSTDAERALWDRLRGRGLDAKFRRQAPIDHYIVDFVSTKHRLVIELDGGHQADQRASDESRTRILESLGFRVLRFWDNDVLQQPDSVLEAILMHLEGSPADQTPSP